LLQLGGQFHALQLGFAKLQQYDIQFIGPQFSFAELS
jgi:hypothetical protein